MRLSRVLVGLSAFTLVTSFVTGAELPSAIGATSIGSLADAGARPGATRLSFTAGDRVQAQVDVGSGDLYVTYAGLALQGVGSQVQVGAFYNSAATSLTSRLGKGWGIDDTPDVRVAAQSDNSVTFYGPGGLTGNFALKSGSTTTYTAPAGFEADLVKTGSGWDLTEHSSRVKQSFDTSGALVAVTDRNGNKTTVAQATGQSSFQDVTIVTPGGPVPARTATVSTDAGGLTRIQQPNTNTLRKVAFRTTNSTMTQATDPLGRQTTFGYDSNGLLTSITAPGDREGTSTQFAYDSSNRITSITQVESSGSGPGNSVTRLTYPSTTQTLLAGPVTDQAQSVSAVPHTTYTIDSTKRVTAVTDAAGRKQSKTYTANFDTASTSSGTTSPSTTTNTWGANNTESLTQSKSGTGASSSATYANAAPNQYLPDKGTDPAGNSSTFTYNGTGNQLTSSDAAAAKTSVNYNSDGTASNATAPNNGTNRTVYGYTDHQVTSVTPVTGTSLGVKNTTYDQYGRLATSTDGRGNTTTYSYDLNDRLTSVGYTGGMVITYGFDTAGRTNSRADNSGTTTYNYDQLGRLASIQNAAFGGVQNYGYDKSSRLTSSSNPSSGGTITYTYDNGNTLTGMTYPSGSATKTTHFKVDDHGRRTDTWLNANADNSTWTAHIQDTYDVSDRVSHLVAYQGTGNSSNSPVVDLTYCYLANIAPGGTCTYSSTNAAYDRSKLQWMKNNKSGTITTYGAYASGVTTGGYDKSGRLLKAVLSGGTAKTYSYGYNSNGARTSAAATGATTQALTFNAANQITASGYSYDGAGNLTAKPGLAMSYTNTDQLATVTKSGTTYSYTYSGDANSELVKQTTPNGTYQYAYGRNNPQGTPTLEQVGLDNNTASVINDPTTGQPLMLQTSSGVQALIVASGTTGSPIALIASSSQVETAYDYDPYGVPTVTTNNNQQALDQNPYTFAGGIADRTTGWIHYNHRYYDTTTGTFTQQDNLDNPLDAANANRYAYAGDDPVNNTDPTGQHSFYCVASVIGLGASLYGVGAATVALAGAEAAATPETAGVSAAAIGPTIGLGVSALGLISSEIGLYSTC